MPGFSGDIPSSLSAVTDLEFLDLSNNRLNDTLANVVALRSHPISTINLSNNKVCSAEPDGCEEGGGKEGGRKMVGLDERT